MLFIVALNLVDAFPGVRFNAPVGIVPYPYDSSTLYVVQQNGVVKAVNLKTGKVIPVLDIRRKVKFGGEMGLLGMAFHPEFPRKPNVYVYYVDKKMRSVLSEFRVDSDGHIVPKSERVLLRFKQPYSNHNGGQVAFGPDGYLYLGLGDGGWAGDPHNNAQDTTTLLGSLLRIDVSGDPYSIPPDNPFAKSRSCKTGCPEIYAWGLRNPWRFSFDRETGTLWLADVGQDKWEEIDTIVKGGNYGWRCYEGNHPYNLKGCGPKEKYMFPVYEYGHKGGNCSITGGYVYRGKEVPELYGKYIFGDFCSGKVWALERTESGFRAKLLFDTDFLISTFGENHRGEVYVVDYKGGKIYRIGR